MSQRVIVIFLKIFISLLFHQQFYFTVPEAPPINVRAEAINSTAVEVWWKPPNPQKINGINQGYKLQAWIGDNFTEATVEYKSMTVPPSLFDPLAEQSAIMTGLRKYTLYNITVLCFTDPGDGERSSPVEVRTQEDGVFNL